MGKVIVLAIMLKVILIQDALGFSFTQDFNVGVYWASLPISLPSVMIKGDDTLESLVIESMEVWEEATGLDLWEVGDSGSFTAIRWSDSFGEETGYDPETTLAITTRYNDGVHITQTEIILNSSKTELVNNRYGLLKKTLIHELGHTLGLGHSDEYAIMQPIIGSISYPTDDDIEGLEAVYDETIWRQESNYIPEGSSSDISSSGAMACGSVSFSGGNGGGSGNPPISFLVTLFMALIVTFNFGKMGRIFQTIPEAIALVQRK